MKTGFVIAYGPYLYAHMNEGNTRPIFTYNWLEARIYEDEEDCIKMKRWLINWNNKQSYKMKDWTKIVSDFRIIEIAINDNMTNIKVKKNEKKC